MEKNKVQVLHCLRWVGSGGPERRRLMLADELGSDFYEHILLCQVAKDPLRNQLIAKGWSIREIGIPRAKWDIRWLVRAVRVTSDLNPQIIHGAVSEGNILAGLLSFFFRNSIIVTEETSDGEGRRCAGSLLARLIYNVADTVVAVSPAVEGYLVNSLGVSESRVRLISNGVPIPRQFDEEQIVAFRREIGIRESAFVVGSVGRLVDSHKGFSKVLRALPQLSEKFEDIIFLIVGEGPDRSYLEQLCENLGVKDLVVFAGYRGTDQPIYEVMDVFVLASSMEAFGLVLVEAMLSKVPVVASRVGGIPHILAGGNCGTLVNPNNSAELSGAIARLLSDLPAASLVAETAYTRAIENFTSDRYVKSVKQLWSELLSADSEKS